MIWVRSVDRFQRHHPMVGLPIGVVYKYFDDHGPYLAAILTYYSFVAIFPIPPKDPMPEEWLDAYFSNPAPTKGWDYSKVPDACAK